MTNARARWRNSVAALATGVVAAIAANSFGLGGGVSPRPPAPQVQDVVLQQHGLTPAPQRIDLPLVTPVTATLGNANSASGATFTGNATAAAGNATAGAATDGNPS